jgi:hypothetical protein
MSQQGKTTNRAFEQRSNARFCFDDFVKSPDAALHCIRRQSGILTGMPLSSGKGLARHACGSFYAAVAVYFLTFTIRLFGFTFF